MAKPTHGLNPADHALTPEQLERAEKIAADARAELEKRPLPERYLGKPPGVVEAEEAAAEKLEDRQANAETASDRRRISWLEEQLAETQALLKKMAQEKGGYNAAVGAIAAMEASKEREATYERIRSQGGICTIVIHTHDDPAQNHYPVPVLVDPVFMRIKRGVPTGVPWNFVEVLDHAVVTHEVSPLDANENPEPAPPPARLQYPYTLIDYNGRGAQAGILRKAA